MKISITRKHRLILRRLTIPTGKLALFVILLCFTLWGIFALAIDIPFKWLGISLAVVYALGNLCLLFYVLPLPKNSTRSFRRAVVTSFSSFALILIWWNLISPSHDREWYPDVAQMPWGELDGDRVTLHNIRNFNYRTATDYDTHYTTRSVNLSDIEGIDYFLSYWGSPLFAHPIVSFQFKGEDPIAFSIEARKEIGESYSAIRALFRQYELIYIVAEERDVVRVRTNIRKNEDVYLYRTASSPERAKSIFLDYVRRVNELYQQPAFYNTLMSNCTTNIRIHTATADGDNLVPWDWRILLNGKIDEMSYERGSIDQSMPFEELKTRSNINEKARGVKDLNKFQLEIRNGLPGF